MPSAPHGVWQCGCGRCGNSSVGRARPCHGRGHEFESRFPLHNKNALRKKRMAEPGASCAWIKQRFSVVDRYTHRLAVRTTGFLPVNRGSSPLGCAKNIGGWQSGNAPDCKSGVLRGIDGSNPSPSTNYAGMAEWLRQQPSKLITRVRFSLPAPFICVSS